MTCLMIFVITISSNNLLCGNDGVYFHNTHQSLDISNLNINCITQDSIGFIWFGTMQGLYRFDGHEVKRFSYLSSGKDILKPVSSLLFTSDNSLWLGTTDGIFIYNNKKENFAPFTTENNDSIFNKQIVLSLFEDSRRLIWIGTDSGIYNVSRDRRSVIRIPFDNTFDITSNLEVRNIAEDNRNNMWMATSHGLFKYVVSTDKLIKYDFGLNNNKSLSSISVLSLLLDPAEDNILWVGTEAGLYRLDYIHDAHNIFRRENTPKILNNRVWTLGLMKDSSIVFGTDMGVCRIDRKTGDFYNYRHDIIDPRSLSNNVVRAIFKDRSGIIWFGTEQGVSFIKSYHNDLESVEVIEKYEDGFIRPVINDLANDGKGSIWLATNYGIIKIPENRKLCITDEKYIDGLHHNIVRAVHFDKSGVLWAGTDFGLHYYDDLKKIFVRVEVYTNYLVNKYISSIAEDAQGNIWVSAVGHGLCAIRLLKNANNAITGYDYKIYDIPGIELKAIAKTIKSDELGRIWAITYDDEIFYYDPEKDGLELVLDPKSNQIFDNINSIEVLLSGEIYICTSTGLYKFNVDSGIFVKTVLNKVVDKPLMSIIEVGKDMLLITADQLIKYDPLNEEINLFEMGRETNVPQVKDDSQFIDKNGIVYLGGFGCFLYFDPELLECYINDNLELVITALDVNNKEYSPGNDSFSDCSISMLPDLTLPSDYNSFNLHLSMLDYQHSMGSVYEYMLEGFDDCWKIIRNGINIASYSNVPPGKYKFKARGMLYTGFESKSNDAELNITVLPPCWMSFPAYIGYSILGLSFLVLLYRWVIIRIKMKNELEVLRVEKEKAKELNRHKLHLFTNFSHEYYKHMALLSPKKIILESEDDKLISDFAKVVQENIDNPDLKIDLICSVLKIPDYQLYRRLKSLTSKTPNELIRSIRLERAAQLFKDTNLNIGEVIDCCGFSSRTYFYKCFEAQYSMKPSEFVKKHRRPNSIVIK